MGVERSACRVAQRELAQHVSRGVLVVLAFDEEYTRFIKSHRSRRQGNRLARLKDGHGHGEKLFLEKVWWPAFHQFELLHPEYEVFDYKDGYRYIDFAYIHNHFRIAIEIDGFGPHWRNITKWQFSDHCNRQNHLVIDGWQVIRFAYDDVECQPRTCQQILHQLLGRLLGNISADLNSLNVVDREIIRLVMSAAKPITAKRLSTQLNVSREAALRRLHALADTAWLQPASGSLRIRTYQLHPSRQSIQL